MFYVSARKSLASNHAVGSELQVFEAPEKKFGPDSRSIQRRTLAELCDATRRKKVLCLVHGYANPIDSVSKTYGLIHRKVCELGGYDVVMGFTWPSVKFVLRWWKAKRNSEKVDQAFVTMCRQLEAKHLDVMTHSLGARVVLSGLDELAREQPTFRNVFLTAPAVDNESLEKGEEFYGATAQCKRVFVLHSKKDEVLKGAYLASEGDRALGLHGPESFAALRDNVHVVNCKKVVGSHGAYRSSPAVYAHLGRVLSGRKPPRWEQL